MALVGLALLVWAGGDGAAARASGTDPVSLTVQVTETSGALALAAQPAIRATTARPPAGSEVIAVDDAVRHQSISGFGAAMTDTSAWLLEHQLPAGTRTSVFSALFSASGLRLSSVLIPMGASDFTATGQPYSYDDQPAGHSDPRLTDFSVRHDQAWVLPALRTARALNPGLSFIAVPWSVPAWMKSDDTLANPGGSGTVAARYDQAYADYFLDFLGAYAAAGVPVSEIIPANEPTSWTAYPGMDIPASSEAALISDYLAPTLRAHGLHPAIYGSDVGWGTPAYASALATGSAAPQLAGIAWHCYYGSPTVMSQVQALNPHLGVQMTECSPGISTVSESEVVIESLRNDASLVDLWNIALDSAGGPVQAPNHGCPSCFGLIRVDTAHHSATATSAYADLGQASEFIDPGAVRIGANSFVGYRYLAPGRNYATPNVDDVAVENPDHQIVLMAYNNASGPRRISVTWRGWSFSATLAARETATYRWPGG